LPDVGSTPSKRRDSPASSSPSLVKARMSYKNSLVKVEKRHMQNSLEIPIRPGVRRRGRIRRSLVSAALLLAVGLWSLGPAVARVPDSPRFGPIIEGYARYDPQTTCQPNPKPGVVAFRDLILETYPRTGAGRISRACNIGSTSEHKEGRAWDWGVNAANPNQKRKARLVLDWLFAKDRHGNRHARARRLGIMYIMWNRRMWSAWVPGWERYCVQEGASCISVRSGSPVHPHRDHMHFSFSWKGARANTTFWNPELSRRN
jgi:hypothetical protein